MTSSGLNARAQDKKGLSTRFTSKRPLKVALVEPDCFIRDKWAGLINSFPSFACIFACSNGEDMLRMIRLLQPDVVLMDIFLPRMSGIQCTARIKALSPETQIVIFTTMADRELVFMALKAGANGYLLKCTKPLDLRAALLDVVDEGAPITGEASRHVVELLRKKSAVRELPSLSARQEQVLFLLSQGYTDRRISEKLGVSLGTVHTHVKHVFAKFRVGSRTEAAILYLNNKHDNSRAEVVGE